MSKTIRITCETGFMIPLEDLLILQDDLKDLSKESYEKLKKEILTEGFSAPFFVWKDDATNWVLDGTQRLRTLLQMQYEGYQFEFFPYVPIKAKTMAEAKRKLLGYASQYGNITSQGLYEFMSKADIPFDEMDARFRFPEIKNDDFKDEFYQEPAVEGEDDVPEVRQTKIQLGDLFQLGNHRLLCGDSTDAEQVSRLMNGEKADMVYTDPPYGMNLDTDFSSMDGLSPKGKSFLGTAGGKVHRKVIGDNEDFKPSLISTVQENFEYCKEIFLWGADYYAEHLTAKNDGSWIVWDKRANEGSTDEAAESADRLIGSSFELCWSKSKHKREIARIRNGIFGVKNESGNSSTVHPTQKPVQLAQWFFDKWGKDKTNIIDLYIGSGSTLIACEKTERKCYGMEIDPQYTQVVIDRFIKFVGSDKDVFKIEEDGTKTPYAQIKSKQA